MARRKQSPFEDVMDIARKLPWWAGVILAIAAYFGLHSVATSEVTTAAQPGQMGQLVGQTLIRTLALFGQYVLPSAFLFGAAISACGQHKRQALHEQVATSANQSVLNNMSWQQFETLVGEAFRRKGYAVTETGGGGADGGIDLVLQKDGETFLVQCKQWRAFKVGVTTVRELYGVMAAKGAAGGFVVTSGVFTEDAKKFSLGRNIELLDGEALHVLIRGLAVSNKTVLVSRAAPIADAPICPVCQSVMKIKTARKGANAGNEFWGCSQYPACKGMRSI